MDTVDLWLDVLSHSPLDKDIPHELLTRQVELEYLMRAEGVLRHDKNVEKAQGNLLESTASHGRALLRDNIYPVALKIEEELKEVEKGKPGAGNAALRKILPLSPHILSFLTLSTVINSMSTPVSLQAVTIALGGAVELEVRCTEFTQSFKKEFMLINARASVKRGGKVQSIKNQMRGVAQGNWDGIPHPDVDWEAWETRIKNLIGMRLIDIALGVVPLVEVVLTKTKSSAKPVKVMKPSPEMMEWSKKFNLSMALLSPVNTPCVIPPKDWSITRDGGYHTGLLPQLSLIKTADKDYLKGLDENPEQLSKLFWAVNIAQHTGWRVNKRVYDVLSRLWRVGSTLGDLPAQEDVPKPPCPKCGGYVGAEKHECFTDKDVLSQWIPLSYAAHRKTDALFSKRILVHRVLWFAELMLNDERFYFPYQVDFRGRLYCVPQHLNPQGTDIAKALLEFADAKPILDDEAADWLAIHVANTWGEDKISFEDRIKWVADNEAMILAIAKDPLEHTDWSRADSPYCFLAACFEWAGFTREGFGYMSRIPIAMDGTCSGLQHYSAILRDEVGGAAVNLIPMQKPNDIYAVVAEKTTKLLSEFPQDDEDYITSQEWLSSGLINRKLMKRAVMTLPYGASMYSAKKYYHEHVKEMRDKESNKVFVPWQDDQVSGKACNFFGKIGDKAIKATVIAAAEAMDWIKKCARVVTKKELPLVWTSPIGLPIMQRYTEFSHRRVNTFVSNGAIFGTGEKTGKVNVNQQGKTRLELTLREATDTIDKNRQVSGLAPNFIHSLDASAMMFAVIDAKEKGVNSFSLIHDSFATHAADTAQLAKSIRETFVGMYERHDVVAELREALTTLIGEENSSLLPEPPKRGNLDLSKVLQSRYFFA